MTANQTRNQLILECAEEARKWLKWDWQGYYTDKEIVKNSIAYFNYYDNPLPFTGFWFWRKSPNITIEEVEKILVLL